MRLCKFTFTVISFLPCLDTFWHAIPTSFYILMFLSLVIILTRGMGKRLTYGILARYRVVLVEHLGGLFFDGERSCAGDSFAGHSGLYCCESLVVSILFCV